MNKMIALIALVVSCASLVSAQQSDRFVIREVPYKAPAVTAPKECVIVFREFFRYLQFNRPGIIRDERAQRQFLSEYLQKILKEHVATFASQPDVPDFPSNNTFIGTWDPPTTYSIVATRRYGKRAVIDVLYKWGPNTNYRGDERTTSFIFLQEDGTWKLDDIYTLRGKFVTAESLNQYLLTKR